jgi:hypothetical protein
MLGLNFQQLLVDLKKPIGSEKPPCSTISGGKFNGIEGFSAMAVITGGFTDSVCQFSVECIASTISGGNTNNCKGGNAVVTGGIVNRAEGSASDFTSARTKNALGDLSIVSGITIVCKLTFLLHLVYKLLLSTNQKKKVNS